MRQLRFVLPALVIIFALTPPALAQSRRAELRGAWMASGYDRDWPAIMQSLRDNGFSALFPNFSTGAVAYYPSQVLPAREPSRTGDELAAAAAAAREHGIELHVWRINWALYGASPEQIADLEQAGRLQRNSRGELARDDENVGVDWLCPSDLVNRKLEREAMLELVREYDIAGIHFDYMRFPGEDYCFCEGCKERFQQQTGVQVANWPADVLSGELSAKWRDWRRELLTSLAKEISKAATAADPDVYLSVAAWPHLEVGREAYGQDWVAWARNGVVDFVCPMDYTLDRVELARLLEEQTDAVRGAVPLYAGLGAFKMQSLLTLIEQVEAARAAGADGFVAFSYAAGRFAEWLPDLRATVASADPNPAPHGHPPARLAFSGEAAAAPAAGRQVIAGADLEVDIVLGWEQPVPDDEAAGAAEAGAMLERALDIRDPIETYDDRRHIPEVAVEEERLTARIVIETPEGSSRMVLGGFDSAYRFQRKLTFAVPEGAFRFAIYGDLRNSRGTRGFVIRGPVLTGVPREELGIEEVYTDFEKMVQEACDRPEAAVFRQLAPVAVQFRATDPGGGEWWLRFVNGECETGTGAIENPDLTFEASAADFAALARGEVDARALWERARLSVIGDDQTIERLIEAYTEMLRQTG
jgi:uncharacterized lipoprotein YddW (UPF0748 family)